MKCNAVCVNKKCETHPSHMQCIPGVMHLSNMFSSTLSTFTFVVFFFMIHKLSPYFRPRNQTGMGVHSGH